METGKALEIVHGMAFRHYESPCPAGVDFEEAETALNTVKDLIVNNFGEDDETDPEPCSCGTCPGKEHDEEEAKFDDPLPARQLLLYLVQKAQERMRENDENSARELLDRALMLEELLHNYRQEHPR